MDVKINFGDFMYMSTITSMSSPLKMKIVPGEYTLREHKLGGHIFAKHNYVPANEHIRKILNLRDGDPGLSGTYWDGHSEDPVLLDYLNTYFKPYFTDDTIKHLKDDDDDYDYYDDTDTEDSDYEGFKYDAFGYDDSDCEDLDNRPSGYEDLSYIFDDHYDDSDRGDNDDEGYNYRAFNSIKRYGKIRSIPDYHNIPVMFYSKMKLPYMNLSFLKWYKIEKSDTVVWGIKHKTEEDIIGVAVQQPRFYEMMGDQMGLAAYSENGLDALGIANFNLYSDKSINFDDDVFESCHKSNLQYVCAQ